MTALRSFILIVTAGLAGLTAAEPLSFNRDVRQLLSDACYRCHGPDEDHRKGKLRLDIREAALAKKAFVPGKPKESEFVKRLRTTDEDDIMPPKESPRQLTDSERDILERWIAEGAVYEPHWAYVVPKKASPPKVSDAAWQANPIDAFIRQRLDAAGLTPSPEADRATLIRRLSLDLIGLPPTPAEVAAFVADKNPDAYERLVTRLLSSPHFGERMAVSWLDVARFADTVGFHGDQNQHTFPFRDWVINAFNTNMPFDRFTAEQLAGDLLPDATDSTRVASGFNRLNMMTREGGAQPKEYLAKYAADRVRTLGGAWLGSTLACAECHNHKFDPWATKDFYQFAAYFADVKQWGVYADYGYTPNKDLRGFNNDYPFPPEIEVDSPYLQQRIARLQTKATKLAVDASPDQGGISAWQKDIAKFLGKHTDGWQTVSPAASGKADFKAADGVISITAKRGSNATIPLTNVTGWVSSVRIALAPTEKANALLSGKGKGKPSVSIKVSHQAKGAKKATDIGYRIGNASAQQPTYKQGSALLGLRNGWTLNDEIARTEATAVFVLDQPVQVADGDTIALVLPGNILSRIRVAVSPLVPDDLTTGSFSAADLSALKADAKAERVAYHFLAGTGQNKEAYAQLKDIQKDIEECNNGKAMTCVTEAWEPAVVRVLPRGNWQDESGEIVQPKPPGFLFAGNTSSKKRQTRLDLAKWLTSPENPLTARVFVNRTWAMLMGVGLCASVDDFGMQGEPPSHPKLLDWLAVDFRENGWDIKRMITQIVMSKTYRQSSVQRQEVLAKDPANRLRAMQSVRRLDAEFVRDNALAISGLLVGDIGGPSVKPYQPPDYYVNIQFPNRDYVAETDDRQYRRGVYMHWQRTFLHPMLANFDAPSREDCTAIRTQANSPQQALTLLNDPTFVEAARAWAVRLRNAAGDDAAKINHALHEALSRAPSDEESARLLSLLNKQRKHYAAAPDQATALLGTGLAPLPPSDQHVEVAAWTQVCRVLLNLHETISRL